MYWWGHRVCHPSGVHAVFYSAFWDCPPPFDCHCHGADWLRTLDGCIWDGTSRKMPDGPPSWSASSCLCRQSLGLIQRSKNGSISAMGWRNQTESPSGTLCRESSALTGTWASCHASSTLQRLQSQQKYVGHMMMPTWQATSLGWFLRTGRTNMSSVELWYPKVSGNYLKSLSAWKRPTQLIKWEKGLRMRPSLMTRLKRRWSLSVTRFRRNAAQRITALSTRNMGVHIPPITLQTAGSMIPTGPWRRTSRGRHLMEPLVDLRDLLEEEVALCNYPLKSTKLKSPTRKWSTPSPSRKLQASG